MIAVDFAGPKLCERDKEDDPRREYLRWRRCLIYPANIGAMALILSTVRGDVCGDPGVAMPHPGQFMGVRES